MARSAIDSAAVSTRSAIRDGRRQKKLGEIFAANTGVSPAAKPNQFRGRNIHFTGWAVLAEWVCGRNAEWVAAYHLLRRAGVEVSPLECVQIEQVAVVTLHFGTNLNVALV